MQDNVKIRFLNGVLRRHLSFGRRLSAHGRLRSAADNPGDGLIGFPSAIVIGVSAYNAVMFLSLTTTFIPHI